MVRCRTGAAAKRSCIPNKRAPRERDCTVSGLCCIAQWRVRLARKFLYVVVVLIMLALAAAFASRFYGVQLMPHFMVPAGEVVALPPADARAYAKAEMWI